jgi:4'-phosphopantetheinyl transferase
LSTHGVDSASHGPQERRQLISLTPAEIHLWLTFYEEETDASVDNAYRELLNAEEQQQERRFHFARDRRRYLITRTLVRTVLSRYLAIHPQAWIFSTNAYGRPEIVNPLARDASLVFNVSHASGLIVLSVSRGRALGVDVENYNLREISIDIADRYFAAQEVAELNALPSEQQRYRFFEYWTFKEAYIKARGMGLSLPLDKFSFHYPDEHTVELATDAELADDSKRWQFWQFRPKSEYLVAICAERLGTESPGLIVRHVIPMVSESHLALEVLRASHRDVGEIPS